MNDRPVSTPYRETSSDSLSRLDVTGLGLLLILIIAFGGVVLLRGALLKRRMTDIGPYLRAAWAVRSGADIYHVTGDRGLHYTYPPLFAILMTPLADPPNGADRTGYLPYAVSVGIWYVVTMALGLAGLWILARAVEDPVRNLAAGRGPPYSQRWWRLRVVPLLILLPAIGRSEVRGQVNLLIAFLLCCMAASILKGRRFRAGLWLSAAISILVIPALLLAFPLWRRDWRMLFGSALGLLVCLIVVPVTVFGPPKTATLYRSFFDHVIVAGISGNPGGKLGKELTGIASTDSNSPMCVIHNIMYPNPKTRPSTAGPWVRAANWVIGFLTLALTLLLSGWKGRWYSGKVEATISEVAFLCALIPLMFTTSPVFHPHFVAMALPLVLVMLVILWERFSYGHIPARWQALFWFVALSHVLTSIDMGFFNYLREFGLVLLSTVALWAAALILIKHTAATPSIAETSL